MASYKVKKIDIFNSWEEITPLENLTCPWTEKKVPSTFFKAFYDGEYLHFRFDAEGPAPLIYEKANHKLEVVHSERVELFFRSDEKMNPYYCLEMDPKGRVLDYEAHYYRDFNREWTWPHDLNIQADINKKGYSLEGQIALKTLEDLGLLKNHIIEAGVYRGHCTEIVDDKGHITWMTWVNPGTASPDFHVPSSFGVFKLS